MTSGIRKSPVRSLLAVQNARFRIENGAEFVDRFGDEQAELSHMRVLGLCDVSSLKKLGLKGPGATEWLKSQQIDVPESQFASRFLSRGGRCLRTGSDEFFLESGFEEGQFEALARVALDASPGVFAFDRSDATFLLTGSRSREVLAQTCGINFDEAEPGHVIFTRVAGVSAAVLPESCSEIAVHRFWVDASYAVYLWETLFEICDSLGGSLIGATCLFPELRSP